MNWWHYRISRVYYLAIKNESIVWRILYCDNYDVSHKKIRLSFRFCNLDLRNHPSQGLGLSISAALIWKEYLSVFFSLMFLWKGFKEASSSVSPVCESPIYLRQEFRVHKPDRRQSWLKKFVPIHRLVYQMGLSFFVGAVRAPLCVTFTRRNSFLCRNLLTTSFLFISLQKFTRNFMISPHIVTCSSYT